MAAVVEPAAPPPLPEGGEVLFELDKYNLTPEAQAAINDMIFDIRDRELEGIKVVGHTDTSCPPGDNQAGCRPTTRPCRSGGPRPSARRWSSRASRSA